MINPVVDDHVLDQKRIDAFEAADIVTVLPGVGAAPMMGIDAANRAKIMLGLACIELVQMQLIRARPGDVVNVSLDEAEDRYAFTGGTCTAANGEE